MARLELKIPPVVLLFLVAAAMWGIAGLTLTVESPPWLRLGLAAVLLIKGVWIVLAGVRAFRRASTTVNPMTPEDSSKIVERGIYSHTRNPMYLGMLLMLIAWAVWLASPWALIGPAAFAAWITRFQILPEERALSERFGEDYRDYCRRVRSWI